MGHQRSHHQIKQLKGPGSTLENHHNLPNEFKDYFRYWGIEPEDYKMFVEKSEHRLKPDGLHTVPMTGIPNFGTLFMNTRVQNQKVFAHLSSMMKRISWLKI